MQTLYLVRHTTPSIAPGICYGQLDVDVADSFAQEAREVLRLLPPPGLIITSPLLRARRLAEYLAAEQRCALRRDERLMEKSFGAWEGRAWDGIARSEMDAWAADVMGHAPPQGESAQQLMWRVNALLREAAQLPQRSIALVAHGGSIRAVLAQLAGVPLVDVLSFEMGFGAVIGVRNRFPR